MKKLIIPAITALVLLSFTVIDPLPIGSPLPGAAVELKDVSGKTITLQKAQAKNGLLVIFSCNTCPYVIKNQERNNAICAYAQKNNIGVIILNSNEAYRGSEDSYEAMQAYAKEQQYKWHYAVDANHTLADAFGATRTPECFLFDKASKLVYHGAIDNNPSDADNVTRKHLQTAIDELLAGTDIAVKQSKSVGCTIKRKKQ
ncbi:MAG TPA: thioredoxin family protein [Ferruginibacter sp.]|nr:thioredoxin family protein [Ferruginibacter sp.]HMP21611.1 thioredoxin family protein [Ferruginibacter sp.]